MTAYALAHLRTPTVNPDVLEYIDRIQGTLDPYGGRFLVHGGDVEVVEGEWPGSLAIIAFPDLAAARAWYASPAYRGILHLRTGHVASDAILVDGVPDDYDPRATAALLAARPAAQPGARPAAQPGARPAAQPGAGPAGTVPAAAAGGAERA